VGDDAPKLVANDEKPKGEGNLETWPTRREYSGLGSQLWEYCVPYQASIQKALEELREREFKAGRFYRSELRPKTFEDAIRNADAAGTRSIIDIDKISATRELETISPAPLGMLHVLFETDKPSHAMVESASKKLSHDFQAFLETYGRGEGLYIILYDGDRPIEIYFAGWSYH
jgi:hypothetical protein